jgi:uncharacterized membrane-anchored protein YhcB (DUF1043 family)
MEQVGWAVAVGGFALGAAFALGARWLLGGPTARERQLETLLEGERERFAAHREKVEKHFQETAQLFQDLSYQHALLYRHLRDGMRDVCGHDTLIESGAEPGPLLESGALAEDEEPRPSPRRER